MPRWISFFHFSLSLFLPPLYFSDIGPPLLPRALHTKTFSNERRQGCVMGDGWLAPTQLLIINFYSSQTKAILPSPKCPGKRKIRTV